MRRVRIPIFVLLIVLIGLGVVFVAFRTLTSRATTSYPQAGAGAEIFVAGQNIPQGAVITEDELATIGLPQDKVSAVEFSADQKSQLVGKVAKFPLEAGVVITNSMVGESPHAAAMPAPQQAPLQPTGSAAALMAQSAGYRDQMVIKNGDMRLMVKDTDRALEGVTQIVSDMQGYVIQSRVWYQGYNETDYKFATLTVGVPVDQFENAVSRLRSLAIKVLDDNATGEDVTDQYVDLQSQLTNLEATRDRIKSFLEQAQTADEALRVNQQLSDVEMQIEKIKGQMNYLSNRTAFSTITISLEPELPEIAATPTATPIPLQALGPWEPGRVTQEATYTLVSAYRMIAAALIWIGLVLVPVFGPPILLIWSVMWLIRRRRKAAKGQAA